MKISNTIDRSEIMKYLIVVDMQNDFTTGSLGSAHAAAIIPNVVEKVMHFDGQIIFTRDTHGQDYMNTQEGRKLPVMHCVKDTTGWQICDELKPYVNQVVDKVCITCHLIAYCSTDCLVCNICCTIGCCKKFINSL